MYVRTYYYKMGEDRKLFVDLLYQRAALRRVIKREGPPHAIKTCISSINKQRKVWYKKINKKRTFGYLRKGNISKWAIWIAFWLIKWVNMEGLKAAKWVDIIQEWYLNVGFSQWAFFIVISTANFAPNFLKTHLYFSHTYKRPW